MSIFSRSERSFVLGLIILGLVCVGVSYSGKTFSSPSVETIEFKEPSISININTAQPSQLERLPGIGPVLAERIILYGQTSGGFKTIEEIKNVKGIGDKKFEKMKDVITIGE